MKKYILGILSFGVFTSCKNENQPSASTRENSPKTETQSHIQWGHTQEIDSTGIVVTPIIFSSEVSKIQSYSDKEKTDLAWNFVFSNTNINENHLLTQEKILFLNSYFSRELSYAHQSIYYSKHIFYPVIDKDNNENGHFDPNDGVSLYSSDITGRNFKKISPENTHLLDWNLVASTNKIIMKIQTDSNNDQKFTPEDSTTLYEYFISEPEKRAEEIFDPNFRQEIQTLMEQNWKN